MIVESKYIDMVLDAISTYTASVAMSENKKLSKANCLKFIAEETSFDINDLDEAFGEIINNELNRIKSSKLTESAENFSDTLNEDAAEDVDQQVQAKTKGSNDFKSDDADRRNALGNKDTIIDRRQFYIYANATKGQILICSVDKTLAQKAKGAMSSFAKNLIGLNQTKYLPGGILVSPINQNEANKIISAKKVKYLNLTKHLGDEQQEQQNNQNNLQNNQNNQQNNQNNQQNNQNTQQKES